MLFSLLDVGLFRIFSLVLLLPRTESDEDMEIMVLHSVFFAFELSTREVHILDITEHPTGALVNQMAAIWLATLPNDGAQSSSRCETGTPTSPPSLTRYCAPRESGPGGVHSSRDQQYCPLGLNRSGCQVSQSTPTMLLTPVTVVVDDLRSENQRDVPTWGWGPTR